MSETTRNPTGHGETATVLTLCLSLGMYLGSLVDDPNLTNFIIGATTIGGKYLQTALSNWLGAPLASMVGAGAMKGAKLGVVLLAMWLPLGCGTLSQDECKGYASLAKTLALQIAEQADPATPEGQALRERWAVVGLLAAQAGCEHLEPIEEEAT